MKINTITSLFKVLCFSVLLVSCGTDVEQLDSNIVLDPDGINNPGNGSNPGDDDVSTADYWPMKIGNNWSFADGGNSNSMKIISSETIEGKTYFRYDNFVGQTVVAGSDFSTKYWTRKSGANYYIRNESVAFDPSGAVMIEVKPFDLNILRDNLEVNGTWQETISMTTVYMGESMTYPSLYEYTIEEKNSQMTIGSNTFNDVIKVKCVNSVQGQVITTYFWFAKNIGLIKYQSISPMINNNFEIVSYQIL